MAARRIISFDAGVRHLAYCILSRAGPNKPLVIEDWAIIDLLGAPVCEVCSEKAGYVFNEKSYCLGDVKRAGATALPKKFEGLKKLKKPELQALFKYDPRLTKPQMFAKAELELASKYYKPIGKTNNYISMETVANRLGAALAKLKTGKLTHAIVEQQMKRDMVAISVSIACFYASQGIASRIISAKNKLLDAKAGGAATRTYAQRKASGITACEAALRLSHPEWLARFQKAKKKDDYADSYLQGVWFMNQL